ncbi:MAG: ABC-F family ATP-binding cassette domain-containing protein [Chloroflexi bacterium]|nr:ABC-F family ATP-binding cassette domain-containing protein [Chloroflexota bacterium]
MLRLDKIAKSFGGQTVLQNVTFQINPGERVGLIGPNGSGKSTILKIAVGEDEPDRGDVTLAPRAAMGYLSQVNQFPSGRTLHEELLEVFAEVNALEERQRQLEAAMRSCPATDPRFQSLLEEYGKILDDFERADGHLVEAKIGQVLAGLAFSPEDHGRPLEHFSGGWQMRVSLAKLLLASPDFLLLDEPTNHLDLGAIEWLEEYLIAYKGSVVVVSHDRYFLDRITQRTLELTNGAVVGYAGNYSFYAAEKGRRLEAQAAAFRRQQAEMEKQEAFINRFRAKATKASAVKSREKSLARLELVEEPEANVESIKLRFTPAPPSGREIVVCKNLGKAYGEKVIFGEGQLAIERGDRIALTGPNGAGKSTLLRILAGIEEPSTGTLRLGHNAVVSYFAQLQAEALNADNTVLDEVYQTAPSDTTLTAVRGLLGRFLLSGDDAFKRIGQLSGGERSRVALAKMLLRPANVLLLDEPTNHLDLGSIEALEEALSSFDGTVLLASHDRRFVDRVATKVLEVEDGKLTLYLGNYSYYRGKKRALEAAKSAPAPPRAKQPTSNTQAAKSANGEARRKAAELECQILALETRLVDIERDLSLPEVYQDTVRAEELSQEYAEAKEHVERLTAEWMDLQG